MAADKVAANNFTRNDIAKLVKCDVATFEKEEAEWTKSFHWNDFRSPKVDGNSFFHSFIHSFIFVHLKIEKPQFKIQ